MRLLAGVRSLRHGHHWACSEVFLPSAASSPSLVARDERTRKTGHSIEPTAFSLRIITRLLGSKKAHTSLRQGWSSEIRIGVWCHGLVCVTELHSPAWNPTAHEVIKVIPSIWAQRLSGAQNARTNEERNRCRTFDRARHRKVKSYQD